MNEFNQSYPTDLHCLDRLYVLRFGELERCPKCQRGAHFTPLATRPVWACNYCGHQLSPKAHTLFHKSDTPLRSWFWAMQLFVDAKGDISAREVMRQTGVTYKTAWRMTKRIRGLTRYPTSLEKLVKLACTQP